MNTDEQPFHGEISQPQHINAVSVRVQPFWKANPALWFHQVEAQFENSRITVDRTKYNMIVSAIESNILAQVSDLVLNPPEENLYESLKNRLLERFADSEQSRLRKLLSNLSVGDRKPSHLLREMRELAGNDFGIAAIKSLWLQRLSPQIQTILSISDDDLEKLASMADKIAEVSNAEIYSVGTSASSTRKDSYSDKILEQIASLTKQVSELSRSRSKSRSEFKSNRNLSNARTNSKVRNKPLCWYHFKFGSNATKCKEPCKFQLDAGK